MGRGFFSGLVMGAIVVAIAAAVLSLASERPDPDRFAQPQVPQPVPVSDAALPEPEPAPEPEPEADPPAPDVTDVQPEVAEPPATVTDAPVAEPEVEIAEPVGAVTEPVGSPAPAPADAPEPVVTDTAVADTDGGAEPDGLPTVTEPPSDEEPAVDTAAADTSDAAVPALTIDSVETPEPEPLPNPGATAALVEGGPLTTFATPQTEPIPDLPRLSVILLDDGTGPLGPSALAAFPFPVSFAIDPAHPNPSSVAQSYRALGFEVLTVARVAEGASPSDVEVALRAALDAVPEAVAVLEAPEGGLQASRGVAAQVASVLSDSGHGLVSMPQGLNTGQQLAAQAGVPSVPLFRDFDSQDQDARVIRRFLDQGAFRAGQEGAVVMLGRLRADTISALVLWGLQDRAQSVAIVPISVVLQEAAASQP